MNKKLKELLDKINALKSEIVTLVDAGKLDEAEAKKKDLVDLQRSFDLMKDVVDPEGDGTVAEVPGATRIVSVTENVDPIHELADAARHRFANTTHAYPNEGEGSEGGYTVPQDIQTRINKFREDHFSLESLVSTEHVSTLSGRRTFQSRASHAGFAEVAEGGKIGASAKPVFQILNYTIKKYAGYLPVTDELLADSDAAIANVIISWLGEEDIATKNRLILTAMSKAVSAQTDLEDLDGIKKALNVTLGQAFKAYSKIVTNDDGLNWLDTLKDENGRYLLQPSIDPADPIKTYLAVGATRVPLVVVPNTIMASTSSGSGASKTLRIPFKIGDLKEGIQLFDRQRISIKRSVEATVGEINAFEQDMTIFRGIIRCDVQKRDEQAWVDGYVSVADPA